MAQATHKTFALAAPLVIEGRADIIEVKCQRPKWKHIKRLMKTVSSDVEDGKADLRTEEQKQADQAKDVDAIDELMRDLCKLGKEEFDEMDIEDVLAIQEWIETFTKKYQGTGKTS